ncbi:MAG: chromate transporter [Sphingobium sp.]|nr:MAG: chromate transporter [Sphingobium sp.]
MASTPSFRDLVKVFARIGCLSFGGPAGQIALMHKELVEDRQWIAEGPFLRALNFCHLLPGPEAQQLATYIGWRLYGPRGGLAAGMLFVVPGAIVILALSILYVQAAVLPWFPAVFLGVKAAVLALVVQALWRIAGRALKGRLQVVLAILSFIALFALALPFPAVVLGAGAAGMIVARFRPAWLGLKDGDGESGSAGCERTPLLVPTLRTVARWLAIWLLPLLMLWAALGGDHLLVAIGLFFSKLAIVTFGGAYAVLAYMAQAAVETHHWLRPGEMADGLGLAETTPGPLIMVTQFVGFLAAYRMPEPFSPLVAGMIGALVTSWVTFAPCFLWIFAFAPWIERLEHARTLHGGLAALTGAVVGVIANLALWFGLHLLFARVGTVRPGPLRIAWPDWASIDPAALALSLLGLHVLLVQRRSVPVTLAICAGAALLLYGVREAG